MKGSSFSSVRAKHLTYRTKRILFFVAFLVIYIVPPGIYAQISNKGLTRPFIWVKQHERKHILKKIEEHPWAASFYQNFLARIEPDYLAWQQDRQKFLTGIPLTAGSKAGSFPSLKAVDYTKPEGASLGKSYMRYLQIGIDCGVIYYLKEDEGYAQCALDILTTFINGLMQIKPSVSPGNGGWLYPGDHLREAREIGAQIPIIYDFVAPFIDSGGKPHNLTGREKVSFPQKKAQMVFRTYTQMALDRGMTGSNWSVLEASGMVQNFLALENPEERASFLRSYLTEGSDRQDPLAVIAAHYQKPGDVYPETSQYSSAVGAYSTKLITILTKYNPSLNLARQYINIPLSLTSWESLKYPNGEIVRFGDGKRYGGTNYRNCEIAYYLGKIAGIEHLTTTFGQVINTAIANGDYERGKLPGRNFGARVYIEPLDLLWFPGEIEGKIKHITKPRTNDMPHASVFLQRNLGSSGQPEDGLMCFVGGSHMVHGHASGMDMELYGKGFVLGVDNGRGSYRKDIHENYSRLFAAHNTVIVNGSSRSDSGWVNLGINPVRLVAMEPMPREDAVSPYYSFSQTSFLDDKGDRAEALQERMLALIRTSDTTGYYVDIFRSGSKLPHQYHDYLYHNIGDRLEFINSDLKLTITPERYMAHAKDPWVRNRRYRHPGWHFFEDVRSSGIYGDHVRARFVAERLGKGGVHMNLFIPGETNREYTKVLAPPTFEAPAPYENLATPALVIRKKGEAWNDPFVVVYEPARGDKGHYAVESVERLKRGDAYAGLKIRSNTGAHTITQWLITPQENDFFENEKPAIFFKGTLALITLSKDGKLLDVYMGEGEILKYEELQLTAKKGEKAGAFVDFRSKPPTAKANNFIRLDHGAKINIKYIGTQYQVK